MTGFGATSYPTLSLHDALPISLVHELERGRGTVDLRDRDGPVERDDRRGRHRQEQVVELDDLAPVRDRKSTRLNSSHVEISYAVFCLKKKTSVAPTCVLALVVD